MTALEKRVKEKYGLSLEVGEVDFDSGVEIEEDKPSLQVEAPNGVETKQLPSPDVKRGNGVRYQRCGGGRRVIKKSGVV